MAVKGVAPGGAAIGYCYGGRGRGRVLGLGEGGSGAVTSRARGRGRERVTPQAAAELGINGKSFGRSWGILRSLRDGGGGARGGRDRSVRVGRGQRGPGRGGGVRGSESRVPRRCGSSMLGLRAEEPPLGSPPRGPL